MKTATTTPKDVFLRLFHILVFYLFITSFITLLIQYINVLIPDPLNFYFDGIAGTVRVATAILIIATPAYLISAWFLEKDIVATPAKRELKIAKWLIYLTLFVSAITIIIDLIVFVYSFLSGELSTQFFFKILVILLVAAAVFGYFLWDLKRTNTPSHTPKILALIVCLIVIGSVVGGFFIVGTPAEQRARRFDNQRVNDLQMLQGEIINYWTQKEKLPSDLNELQDSISGFRVPVDPETSIPYEYSRKDTLSFNLCATFKSMSNDMKPSVENIRSPYGSYQQNWSHKAEKTCFDRVIDPELYKTNANGKMMYVPVR